MAQTWEAPTRCPVCGHDHLLVTRLACPQCGSAVEGLFEPAGVPHGGSEAPGQARGEARFGRLARLNDEQLEFVEVFLRCRGVIKNVEDMLGVSYPTVRGRLNAVLEALGLASDDDNSPAEQRRMRRQILADLSAGRVTSEEALELLARAPAPPDEALPDEDDEG